MDAYQQQPTLAVNSFFQRIRDFRGAVFPFRVHATGNDQDYMILDRRGKIFSDEIPRNSSFKMITQKINQEIIEQNNDLC